MTREQAVNLAQDRLFTDDIRTGACRYAAYLWDYASGRDLATRPLVRGFFETLPGAEAVETAVRSLYQGWLVVFNPADSEPERPEHCIVVWIDETGGAMSVKSSAAAG